ERVGNSELGEPQESSEGPTVPGSGTTILADTSGYFAPDPENEADSLDWGRVTLKMAADNWVRQGGLARGKKDSFSGYRGSADVASAERGTCVCERAGKASLWHRHYLFEDTSATATFADSTSERTYAYAGLEDVKSEGIVICHPRTISSSDQDVLWE